jgi:ribosomal protein S17
MPVLNPSNQFKTLLGTVVNAGERARTIRVRIDQMKWNKRVQKVPPKSKFIAQELCTDECLSVFHGSVLPPRT